MDQMEQVEMLREKTGCSYGEAKAALEETDGDLLDALCWLESHGKTQLTGAFCSTGDREAPKTDPPPKTKPKQDSPVARGFKDLWQGLVDLIRWANRNALVMRNRKGEQELRIPLTVLVLIFVLAFWVMLALTVVALFCGMRFSFEGPLESKNINDAMGKATDFAENIREEIFSDKEDSKQE